MDDQVDLVFEDRAFVLASWINLWDFSLPQVYILVAFYGLVSRKRTLGCIASLLGIKAYLETASSYHLYWKGATAFMCFAYAYGAIKISELGILMLMQREDEYGPQHKEDIGHATTLKEHLRWAAAASTNLRCIGFKCGKREYPIATPTRSTILLPAFLKLGRVDVMTSILHHLALLNSHLLYAARPIWQQFAILFLMGFSLFDLFQGLYGILQYFGIYWLRMPASQWPPMLLQPWKATSLTQFWSKEWHSVFRRIFLFYTDLILDPIRSRTSLGKGQQAALRTITVFLMSALLHDLGLYLFWKQHSIRTYIFFISQGLGILIEQSLGIANHPVIGFVWTYTFLFISGGPFGMIGDVVDHGSPNNTILTDGFFRDVSIAARIVNWCAGTRF